jgi:hypothetical protein
MLSTRAAAATLAVLALLLVAACASGEPERDEGVITEMLGLIPNDAPWRRGVAVGDVAAVREMLGVERPGDLDDEAAFIEYVSALFVGNDDLPNALPMLTFLGFDAGELYVGSRNYLRSFGFDFGDVDQLVSTGSPPRQLYGARGRFDPDAVADRLAACAECPPGTRVDYGGQRYYAWSDDFRQSLTQRLTPPAFDTLGRGGRIAVMDEFVLRANWTEGIEQMIDATRRTGPLGSLADDPDFGLVAKGLDDLGALAAFMTDVTQGPERAEEMVGQVLQSDQRAPMERAWFPPPEEPVLRPYVVAGIGPAVDEDGQYSALVLVHESAAEAQANAELLPRRIAGAASAFDRPAWSEIFTDVETEVDGRVLKAKLRGSAVWFGLLDGATPLFLHE